MATRAQRPRLPEVSEGQRKARLAWNGGKTGTSRATVDTPVVEACAVEACGTPVTGHRLPTGGLVQVRGAADGARAHWYCPGRCAAIARARAELRAVPIRPGGGR
ncbi:hypothetical protein [Streptomyces justiciae]|uniref:YlxR domain-containing protein n=1 Tax=Streptomyces justiciae TaxID=2780140 RepID=A0ABU3M6U3_9ACTN|nr:hypothetical protein [Streptomyces justiciae]MDT7847247.1 hypothetical protein [Streptomyces justiciae]